ncbi:MAG: hypothetical protein ACAI44_00255, partial [Candidatus Sericytochromatia bacterium]
MQVNQQVAPPLAPPRTTSKPLPPPPSPPVSTPSTTTPSHKALPTPPAPIGSQQETDAIQQHLDSTPTATIQEETQKLEKTPKFKKAEETLIGDVKHDETSKKRADKIAKKTMQQIPPTALTGTPTGAQATTSEPTTSEPGTVTRPADVMSVGVGILPTTSGVYGRFKASDRNIGDTGLTVMLSGGFGIEKHDGYHEDGRVLQTRSKMADLTVGVRLVDGLPVPVSGSIGVAGSYDVAYARQAKPNEDIVQIRQSDPPSKNKLKADPVATLAIGDEIAYRGMIKISATAGAVEPHSHVRLSVGVSVENEFITSVKRIEGDPAKFTLRVEPGNHKIDGKATVAWGPFAVTGGGGYASTVYYEFELDAANVTEFLESGKLPVKIPDPSRYLNSGKELQTSIFKEFNADVPGAKLLSMGATRSFEAFAEASATVAKAKTTTSRTEAIYVRNGEVLHEDIHGMSSGHSAWFHGELKNSLSLTQANLFKEESGQTQLAKEYVGLEAAFKISDTKTSDSDLRKRVELANSLLGTVSSGGLVLPARNDSKWGESSVKVKANITPEVLGKLEALGTSLVNKTAPTSRPDSDFATNTEPTGLNDGERASGIFAIDYMQSAHKVPREAVESMLKDLHEIAQDPKLQGNPDEIRRTQGIRVAGFLASGYTSIVGDEELKLVATLQRLVGSETPVAELKVSSDIHTRQIDGLAVEGFLIAGRSGQLSEMAHTMGPSLDSVADAKARATGNPWDRFNVGAQKLKGLEQIRENLVADRLLDKEEKAGLLKKVDEFITGLNADMNAQLSTPAGRLEVMKGLVAAGPLLPDKLQSLYSSPEKMYNDPNVRNAMLDRVFGAAIVQLKATNQPEELAGLITQVSKMDRGTVGIEQAFMALNAAKDIDPTLQSLVIYHMDTKH